MCGVASLPLEAMARFGLAYALAGDNARKATREAGPPEGDLAVPDFSAFMASPDALVAALAWIASVPSQAGDLQDAVFGLLASLAAVALPSFAFEGVQVVGEVPMVSV